MRVNKTWAAAVLAAGFLAGAGTTDAQAAVVASVAVAYGVQSSANFTSLGGSSSDLSNTPTPIASGAAPGPFNAVQASSGFSIPGLLSIGSIGEIVHSDVDGASGLRTTYATSVINNLDLSLFGVSDLTITQAVTTSVVAGATALSGVGVTTVTGLSNGGFPPVNETAPANTLLYNAAGLTVFLNAQSTTGNGISSLGQFTESLVISFNNAPYTLNGTPGSLNGSIIVGGTGVIDAASDAVSAIPAPAGLVSLAAAGLLSLTLSVRRRRR